MKLLGIDHVGIVTDTTVGDHVGFTRLLMQPDPRAAGPPATQKSQRCRVMKRPGGVSIGGKKSCVPREMTTPELDNPLSCPVVVGRGAPLATLERLLRAAHAGLGAALLISGEAGIGKTRLVNEARGRAATRGVQVPAGASFEPDRAVP